MTNNVDSQLHIEELNSSGFAKILDISDSDISSICQDRINMLDFRFRKLSQAERDGVIHNMMLTMEGNPPVSGPNRLTRWEEGWSENLKEFIASNYEDSALIPGYYRRGISVMRLFGEFILPLQAGFEINVLSVLQAWIAETYLTPVDHVYEFGCGPAHNLLAFAQLFPNKYYHGFDWAKAPQKIIELLAQNKGLQIDGANFDMFHPDTTLKLEKNSAVLTIGSMEQLGQNFLPFFDYIKSQKAVQYVHIEPIKELHNPDSLIDHLAIRFMEKRGYLDGYLDHLRRLEQDGEIEITHCRSLIGSTNYIGWNLIAWQLR